MLGLGAKVVVCDSDKESATRPGRRCSATTRCCACSDNTGEALAGLPRKGGPGQAQPPSTSPSWARRSSSSVTPTGSAGTSWCVRLGRLRPGVHGPHPQPVRARHGHLLLGRHRDRRTGPRRDPDRPGPAARSTPMVRSERRRRCRFIVRRERPNPAPNCRSSTRWKACAKSSPPTPRRHDGVYQEKTFLDGTVFTVRARSRRRSRPILEMSHNAPTKKATANAAHARCTIIVSLSKYR